MFFLVTGASGVGKSTVRKLIEPEFADFLEAAELGMLGSTPKWNIAWWSGRCGALSMLSERESTFCCAAIRFRPGRSGRLLRRTVWIVSRFVSSMREKKPKPPVCWNGEMIRTSSVTMWHSRTGCATMWLTTGIGRRSLLKMPGRPCVGIAGLGWLQSSRLGVVISLRRAS